MKITIPLEAEKELRKFAKQVIKGQAKAFIRTELSTVIKEEAQRLIADDDNLKDMVREAVKAGVREQVRRMDLRPKMEEGLEVRLKNYAEAAGTRCIHEKFDEKFVDLMWSKIGEGMGQMRIDLQLVREPVENSGEEG